MSRRLFLIRHGRTGGNKQRYVGWEDVPLDEEGQRQAAAVAEALAGDAIDAVYASPLSRAVATARPLAAARGLDVFVRPALKEIDYGRYQGLLKADQPLRLRHEHLVERMPGGESLEDVYRRIESAWGELRQELARGRSLAVVGHFWSNRMLAAVIRGVPFEEVFQGKDYKPDNGSVFVFDWEGEGAAGMKLAASAWRIAGDRAP
jgi:broad specificity phosphatase PhoE